MAPAGLLPGLADPPSALRRSLPPGDTVGGRVSDESGEFLGGPRGVWACDGRRGFDFRLLSRPPPLHVRDTPEVMWNSSVGN